MKNKSVRIFALLGLVLLICTSSTLKIRAARRIVESSDMVVDGVTVTADLTYDVDNEKVWLDIYSDSRADKLSGQIILYYNDGTHDTLDYKESYNTRGLSMGKYSLRGCNFKKIKVIFYGKVNNEGCYEVIYLRP